MFDALPADIQARATRAHRLWQANPAHPSLHSKRVDDKEPIYSARIGLQYRAVGKLERETITWFWIGSHDEYERLLS